MILNPKLLIVDDERGIVDMIQSYFQTRYDILTAYSGQEALKKVAYKPDLILLDINMPGMDGLEMVKALKEEYDTFSSIVITGFDEFQYAQQALRLGAADILLKPIENKELVETVRRIARGSVEVRDGVGGLKGERNLSGEGKTTGNVSLNGNPD